MAVERRDSESTQTRHGKPEATAAGTGQDIDIKDIEKRGSNVTAVPEDDDFEFTFGKFMAMLVSLKSGILYLGLPLTIFRLLPLATCPTILSPNSLGPP